MRTVLFKAARVGLILTTVLAFAACEEPTDPSLEPKFEEPAVATTTAPSPTTAANASTVGRSTADIRKSAEAGDVSSMLLLGRSYESLGQAKEARKWYQKAADAGSEDGKSALAVLDTPRPTPTSAAALTEPAVASRTGEPTAKRRATTAPTPATDPTKLRWVDLTYLLDYEDMVAETKPTGSGQFMGVTTSRDKGIFVAAVGKDANDLREVSAIVRVRNKVDPAASSRVSQASALTARVTNDNVNRAEFIEWVTQYVQTEQKSEPIFRNGWTIVVTGYKGEGKPELEKYPHLGTAVMIEMKK